MELKIFFKTSDGILGWVGLIVTRDVVISNITSIVVNQKYFKTYHSPY